MNALQIAVMVEELVYNRIGRTGVYMRALEENIVVEEDGIVQVEELPVKAGDRVKVIVLIPDEQPGRHEYYPLRGSQPYRFDEPTAPVAPEDWESSEQ